MSRDSDKLSRLARRKRELEHVIKHGSDEAAIARRAERVRAAILTVLKKYRPPFFDQSGSTEARQWKSLEDRWKTIPTEEIIEKVPKWRDYPKIADLRIQ